MMPAVKKIVVSYNGTTVGYLAELSDGRIGFQYDEEWRHVGFAISPFSLPLSSEVFINKKNAFDGLFGVFDDSLPNGWGVLLMRRMLMKEKIDYDALSPLTKLTLLSPNGLGALSFAPSQSAKGDEKMFDLDALSKEAKEVLDDKENIKNFDLLFRLGGSSGGTRPKAHLKIGNDYWIIKFPFSGDPSDVGKQEYEANALARQCHIQVNDFKLFPSKIGLGYFGAKRFDRVKGKRVHMVSLSGLLETSFRVPNLDYIYLFQVIKKICVNQEDLYEAFRRMCFNVFYENKDDHGKNFAFLYDDEQKSYKLSAAFDLTKTPYKSEHEMTVNGEGNPSDKDLLAVAKDVGMSKEKCQKIMEEIKKVLKK